MILGALHIYNFEVLVGKYYHSVQTKIFKNVLNKKEELCLKKKYRHITKEKFIFIQNKIGGCMKCQSMIFTYRKNIKKQWVFSVHGFNFVFSVGEFLTKTITPSLELINGTGGFEEISKILKEIFKILQEKLVKTAIDSYMKKLTVNFINQSYFLYDKSNFIKETFVTEINKKILIYGSYQVLW